MFPKELISVVKPQEEQPGIIWWDQCQAQLNSKSLLMLYKHAFDVQLSVWQCMLGVE